MKTATVAIIVGVPVVATVGYLVWKQNAINRAAEIAAAEARARTQGGGIFGDIQGVIGKVFGAAQGVAMAATGASVAVSTAAGTVGYFKELFGR